MRMWAALPLRFMRGIQVDTTPIDRATPVAWYSTYPNAFATRFLYLDNDADRLLNAARFMVVLCGLALGEQVFCWAYEWLGFTSAVFALLFYTLSPNLLAHTSLVTTDAGITCFIFGAVYFLWRSARRFSYGNVAGVALCVAAAVVTKFSGLILGPAIVILLLVAVMGRTAITVRRAALIVAVVTVVSYVSVWAVYGFRYAPSPSPSWIVHLEGTPSARAVSALASVTAWIDGHRLLPNLFTEGFLMFARSMQPPNYTFLAGEYSTSGWWYYFPIAFLIKTPIAFLALIAIGLVFATVRRRALGGINEAFVAIPIAIYLLPAFFVSYQAGLRHILPLYPFLILIAAVAATAMSARTAGRVALASLVCVWVVMFARVYPHSLTFFNRFVGGPSQGYRYLTDSNVDWGQGLEDLKRWMDRNEVSTIGLAYYGSADPAYYGINYTLLPAANPGFVAPWEHAWGRAPLPGYVAVSATVLTGVYLEPKWRLFYEGLRQRKPAAVIGNSIFIYRLDRWPEAPANVLDAGDRRADRLLGDELTKVQWFAHAALHYRRYVERHPDEPRALVKLGTTLVAAGKAREAIPVLQRAVALAPDTGVAHFMLATALFDTRGDIDNVLTHAQRAERLLPDDAGVLVLLARTLAVHGELGKAASTVRQALAIDPTNAPARDLLQRIEDVARTTPIS
jgi:4-amino-4-deoxy-L-arabinose transferase-like glycosyltransferase